MKPASSVVAKREPVSKWNFCCPQRRDQPEMSWTIYVNDIEMLIKSGDFVHGNTSGFSTICGYCFDRTGEFEVCKSGNTIILLPYLSIDSGMLRNSIWTMTKQQYEQIRDVLPGLTSFEHIPLLTKLDCAKIFLHELPEIIGYFPNEKLNDLYLNTDAPEGKEIIRILEAMLTNYHDSQEPVKLKPTTQEQSVIIILDTPDYFEWKPLCKLDNGYCLRLEPGLCIRK
jgi:hypothetical protein